MATVSSVNSSRPRRRHLHRPGAAVAVALIALWLPCAAAGPAPVTAADATGVELPAGGFLAVFGSAGAVVGLAR